MSTPFASWQYEVPWRRISHEDTEKAKKLAILQKRADELSRNVEKAVRVHLKETFPEIFQLTSSREIWKNFRTKELNKKAETLLALNDFKEVPLPAPMDMLMLAEGVVAFPNFYSRLSRSNYRQKQQKFLMFSQPIRQESKYLEKKKNYPDIIQDDIQLYRVLENQAEATINKIYNVVDSFMRVFIRYPIEMILQRIQRVIDIIRVTLYPRVKEDGPESALHPKVRLPSMVDQSSEATENVLVLGESRDEMTLLAHMNPSARLIALPYVLGHKSASTLVSVSLVLFGALPLAYRSLNYAHLYPGLSEFLATSVIGTITYGIWSQRYNARISQSHVLTHALLERVQARDDAVVLALQEGAVRRVTHAILCEYFSHLEQKKSHKYTTQEDKDLLAHVAPPVLELSSAGALVDPTKLAIEIGLLIDRAEAVTSFESSTELGIVSLEEAASKVHRTLHARKNSTPPIP